MPRPNAFLQHNLEQFRASVLKPILELQWLAAKVDPALVDQRTALTLEAIRWAHLGIALEFLPERETLHLLDVQSSFMVHNLDDFIRRRQHHFEPGALTTARDALSRGDFFPMFIDPCGLKTLFQQLLIQVAMANRDFAQQGFAAAINFLSALDWRQLLNMGMNTDSISISVIEAPVVSSLGVARSLDFMGAVRQTAELSLLSAEIEEPDAYLFVRSVSNLVRWRFSIHLPAIQERFLNVAAVMFRSAELPLKLPPAPGAYQLYLDRVRGLLQEWQSWGRTAETLSR